MPEGQALACESYSTPNDAWRASTRLGQQIRAVRIKYFSNLEMYFAPFYTTFLRRGPLKYVLKLLCIPRKSIPNQILPEFMADENQGTLTGPDD